MGYSFRFLKPHHPYLPAWTEYRRRRRRYYWLAFVSFGAFALTAITIVLFPTALSLRNPGSPAALWAMVDATIIIVLSAMATSVVTFFLAFAAQFHMLSTPCPRCGKAFSWTWYWSGHVTHCLHCGLDEYAPCDPAEQQWEFESQMPKDQA